MTPARAAEFSGGRRKLSVRIVVRWTGRIFIVLGMTMLFFVVYELWGTSLVSNHHQAVLAQQFDPQLDRSTVVLPTKTPTAAPRPQQTPIRAKTPIARIVIPKIRLNVIVVEGTTLSDLAYGPGHYVETPLPWEPGVTGIAGHRTGWSQPFYNLNALVPGDSVVLRTTHGTFDYRVTRSIVVDPEDTWVLNGDPRSKAWQRLVLTTCTPRYTSLRRLIVWADLTSAALR